MDVFILTRNLFDGLSLTEEGKVNFTPTLSNLIRENPRIKIGAAKEMKNQTIFGLNYKEMTKQFLNIFYQHLMIKHELRISNKENSVSN